MSILECQWYIVGAEYLPEQALTRRSIVLKALIAYVPCTDTTFEMCHDSSDMLLHAFLQHFLAHEFSVLIVMEPRCALRMPDKAMSHYLKTRGKCLIDKLVGKGKVIDTLLWMNDLTLHTVLCHNPVEMLLHVSPVGCLVSTDESGVIKFVVVTRLCLYLPLIDTDTCAPVVAVGVFQAYTLG